jgi:hypothetical protein
MGLDVANVTDVMNIPRGMHYTPEGSISRAGAEMVGNTAAVGVGFVPVDRVAGKAGSVTADILGMGNSTENAAAMAARTQVPTPEAHQVMDANLRTEFDPRNVEQVQEQVGLANDWVVARMHAPEFAKMDDIEMTLTADLKAIDQQADEGRLGGDIDTINKNKIRLKKEAEKKYDRAMAEVETSARGTEQGDFGGVNVFGKEFDESVIKHMARRFDMPEEEVSLAVTRAGGVRHMDESGNLLNDKLVDIRRRVYQAENDDLYTTTGKPKTGAVDDYQWGGVQETIRPATALLRENVGQGFSARVEQSYMKATADKTALVTKYQGRSADFKEVVEWADDINIKRKFMDLQYSGVAGRTELLQLARREMNQDAYELFAEFVEDSFKHQTRMKDRVFAADAVLDDIHWGIARRADADPDITEEMINKAAGEMEQMQNPSKVDGLSKRERKSAKYMSENHLATYDNPILSQFTRMAEDQDIFRLYDGLGMGPSLRETAKLGDVNAAIVKHVKAVTKNDNKANAAGKVMDAILQGSRKAPPQAQRIFMAQAYAGTLGQVDSAALNMHDVFTAAWRQGPIATGKAVADFFDSSRIRATEFGISDAHVAEFREGVNNAFNQSPTKMDWLEKKVNGYSDVAFTWSGFKALDLAGKGVVMRSTLYDMQRLVGKKDGVQKMRSKYGHLMTNRELAEVTGFLKSGKDIRQASPRQLDILGNAMLGRLAEQQLVSMASRPMKYLKNPEWRPVWAMSGFAIRQADLLKLEVIDRVKKGDYVGAGEAAAGYYGWVVGGYVIVDTMRDAPTYAMSGKDTKDPGNVGTRVMEGTLGPLTFNKAGDAYSLSQFKQDPVGHALESLLPPTGAAGSLGKAGVKAAFGEDPMSNLFEAMPWIGRQLKYVYEAEDERGRSRDRKRKRGDTVRNR